MDRDEERAVDLLDHLEIADDHDKRAIVRDLISRVRAETVEVRSLAERFAAARREGRGSMDYERFDSLLGKTLAKVDVSNEEILFTTTEGDVFKLYHKQDCCESVTIEDVCGDVADLIGTPLLEADESTSETKPEGVTPRYHDSFTWTFYRLRTIKGGVTIRWYGSSNGYYSESVDFVRVSP